MKTRGEALGVVLSFNKFKAYINVAGKEWMRQPGGDSAGSMGDWRDTNHWKLGEWNPFSFHLETLGSSSGNYSYCLG